MHYGCDYYPEHRDRALWAQDALWMREAHMDLVRLGCFAWCRMEPAPGVFAFDWIADALGELQAQGLRAILTSPTAGPTPWLVAFDRPEDDCRMVYEDGPAWEFGGRSMTCVNHPRFLQAADRISEALVERFLDHPAVAGWQIDNELGMYGTRCYCPLCQAGFRRWLERKYGTIAEVNRRLGMVFGSNEFAAFADVVLPRRRQDLHNPGLRLESQRFFQKCNAAFVARQAAVMRAAGARQPITTNVCHMFGGWQGQDDVKLFDACDVAGWDCYPVQFAAHPRPETLGLLHAATRGYKEGRAYWMLEQQSGSPMDAAADDLRQVRLWTWQAVAHGASAILYFRWDTCRFGGEQYWRGILDHVTRKNARYDLVARVGAELAGQAPLLKRLERSNDCAILLDVGACDSFFLNPLGPPFSYRDNAVRWLGALNRLGFGADVVFEPPAPGRYRVLIAPALRLVDRDWIKRLRDFVAAGGTLISGLAAATLDREHVAPDQPVPWGLTDVFGCERIEFSALAPSLQPPKERLGEAAAAWATLGRTGAVPVVGCDPLPGTFAADTWCDHLETQGCEVWARFAEGSPAAGLPAVTTHGFGSGRAVYAASVFGDDLLRALMEKLLGRNPGVPVSDDPWVEIVPCRDGTRPVWFVLNHGHGAACVTLPGRCRELLGAAAVSGLCQVPAYEVWLLQTEDETRRDTQAPSSVAQK